MHCPKCDSDAAVKNGFVKGVQRYKCKNCGCQYTRSTPHGKPMQTKINALVLYLSGLSMRMIGRLVGVTGQSVMRWIREFGQACLAAPQPAMEEEIEIDEMHHFIGKKNGFFGCGKYLVILRGDCSPGNVAIVVRLPLKNCVTGQECGTPGACIPTITTPIRK